MTQGNTNGAGNDAKQLDEGQRLEAYLGKLAGLKERSSLREVTERELLLELIRLNRGRINEFPLLETQQKSISNLLCHRSAGHPGHEYVRKLIANFVLLLGRYNKALANDNRQEADLIKSHIVNNENLLLKCIQGVVYAVSIITDNFEEMVIRYLGEESFKPFNELLEKNEVDDAFWRGFLDRFVISEAGRIYGELITDEAYAILREQGALVLRFRFDQVLERLHTTEKTIQKTRVQTQFENAGDEETHGNTRKVLRDVLARQKELLPERVPAEVMLDFVVRVVCLEPVSEKYKDAVLARAAAARAEGDKAEDEKERMQFDFLREQVVASAQGASIAAGIVIEDLLGVLFKAGQREMRTLGRLLPSFETGALREVFFLMLESAFQDGLEQRVQEEGGRVKVRPVKARRVDLKFMVALENSGLNRIRKSKLFEAEEEREGWIFRPKSLGELASLCSMLQVEPPLAGALKRVFETSSIRTEFMVVMDLGRLAKTTTNLKGKLNDILTKFGIGVEK